MYIYFILFTNNIYVCNIVYMYIIQRTQPYAENITVVVIRLSLKMFYLLKRKEKRPLWVPRFSREGRGLSSGGKGGRRERGRREGGEGLFEIQSDLVAIVGIGSGGIVSIYMR